MRFRKFLYGLAIRTPLNVILLPSNYGGRVFLYLLMKACLIRVQFFQVHANLYRVTEGTESIYFVHPQRTYMYLQGVDYRLSLLTGEYMLTDIEIPSGARIIDVGANVGEFSLAVFRQQSTCNFLLIEPEPDEGMAAMRNLEASRATFVDALLWREDEIVTWYSAALSADSSIFPSRENLQPKFVQAWTLDSVLRMQNDKAWANEPIFLLKVEVEGAEPEVLEGAIQTLERVAYVLVDCGPERGPHMETTHVQVTEIMNRTGFFLIKRGENRQVLLFKQGVSEI